MIEQAFRVKPGTDFHSEYFAAREEKVKFAKLAHDFLPEKRVCRRRQFLYSGPYVYDADRTGKGEILRAVRILAGQKRPIRV